MKTKDQEKRGRRGEPKMSCRLADVRRGRGMSLADVARVGGVNKATVFFAERGHDLTLSSAQKIARGLGVTVEYLWPRA
jgi:DNA-binding XRE family transcriptional regulator